MLLPREVSLKHLLSILNKFQWVAPAAIVGAFWAWQERRAPGPRLAALMLGLSIASALLQGTGAGVVYGAFYEITAASAIAIGLALQGLGRSALARRFGDAALQKLIIALLLVRLLASQQIDQYLIFVSPSFREEVRHAAAVTEAEIARIREIPGPVACSNMTVCYRAGKAFLYDGYWVDQFVATGIRTREEVERTLTEKGIRFEDIDPRTAFGKQKLF
jgi:hypothetical protein